MSVKSILWLEILFIIALFHYLFLSLFITLFKMGQTLYMRGFAYITLIYFILK